MFHKGNNRESKRTSSVVDCIKKIRDKSSLMLDLTYYSLLYQDRELAQVAYATGEETVTYWKEMMNHAFMAMSLLPEMMDVINSFIELAHHMRRAVDVLLDFCKLVQLGYRPHPALVKAVEISEEQVAIVELQRGMTIRELIDRIEASLDVIAVKCGAAWFIDPSEDRHLHKGDLLIVRTTRDVLDRIEELEIGRIRRPKVEPCKECSHKEVESIVRELAYMKNLSEVALDLAYLTVLSLDSSIVEEVEDIEHYFDIRHIELEKKIYESLKGDPVEIITTLRYILCLEEIVDSARSLAVSVKSCPELASILQKAVREGEEVLLKIVIQDSKGLSLRDLALDDLGLTVLAIKRKGDIIVLPGPDTKLQEGDILIIKCFREALPEVKEKLKIPIQTF